MLLGGETEVATVNPRKQIQSRQLALRMRSEYVAQSAEDMCTVGGGKGS